MRRFFLLLVFFLIASAHAGRLPISANIGLVSDYVFRGISQTDDNVAIQGGLDYAHKSGFYLGTWASNIDFNDPNANAEIDGYGGFKIDFWGSYNIDMGVAYYGYPGKNSTYAYTEYYLGGSYDRFSLKAYYSDDFFARSGQSVYLDLSADFPLPYDFSLGLHGGYQWVTNNAKFGARDYADWRVGINREIIGLNLGVAYSDTNLSKNECFSGTDLCGARAVVRVSKVFE